MGIGAHINGYVGEGNIGDGQCWCQGNEPGQTDVSMFGKKSGNGCG